MERFIRAGVQVMRRSQSVNPKVSDVVREAGLSNQAFYRHFKGKDELLAAILEDGARQLLDYLTHLMDKETRPSDKIRRWVTGIMAQAVNPVAADSTRPFVVDSLRLAAQQLEISERANESLRAPLRAAIAEAAASGEFPGADAQRDAETIYYLTMGTMEGYLVRSEVPAGAEIERLCDFVLSGLARTNDRPSDRSNDRPNDGKGGSRGA